jgi:hypothetical protein
LLLVNHKLGPDGREPRNSLERTRPKYFEEAPDLIWADFGRVFAGPPTTIGEALAPFPMDATAICSDSKTGRPTRGDWQS